MKEEKSLWETIKAWFISEPVKEETTSTSMEATSQIEGDAPPALSTEESLVYLRGKLVNFIAQERR